MLYPFLYLAFFLLPGWLITGRLRFHAGRGLLALAFSYTLLTVDLLLLQTLDAPPSWFIRLFGVELGVLAVARLADWRRSRQQAGAAMGRRPRAWAIIWPGLLVLGLTAIYLLQAGPYLEIPADVWEHLRRVQAQMDVLRADDFGALDKLKLWTAQGHAWYFLHAVLCRMSGLGVLESVPYAALLNGLVWVAGIYLFGLKLFAGLKIRRRTKGLMAALAVLFYVLSFGVSVFAYLRYYPLAPTMLAYVVYLAAIVCIMDLMRQDAWRWRLVWPPALFFLALNAIHSQEALYVFFMAWGISLAETIRRWRAWRRAGAAAPPWPQIQSPAVVLGAAALAAWLALLAVSHARQLSPFWVYAAMPIQDLLPFLRGLLVQSPVAHFYPVAAAWGLWVYLLFAWRRREFARMPFIMAGMAMPLLTVFNPVTVDIMLRFFPDPLAMYRLNYLLPLPFVAAYCALWPVPVWQGRWPAWLARAAVWLGLAVLLLPVRVPYFASEYSRLPTLRKVMPENDWRHWRDLVEMLQAQPESSIITDPVTAYMLRGATRHLIRGQRFDYTAFAWWLRPDSPELDLAQIFHYLDRDRRWLLVVNLREGAPSRVGRLSGHWPENILTLRRYYAPRTVNWVAGQPDRFRLIWERDRARVYEVIRPASRP